MKNTDKRFSAQEIETLRSMKGKTLETIEGVLVARGNLAWNTVRLHFTDLHIDLNNRLGEIVIDEFGNKDEFGLMSLSNSSADTLTIPDVGADTTSLAVNKTVEDVLVVNNKITISGDGAPVAELVYPQAVALKFADSVVLLDKETWFSEMIAIKFGENEEGLLYDDSPNWEDDEDSPDTHFDFVVEMHQV